MAEGQFFGQLHQHAGFQALVDALGIGLGDLSQQPGLDARPDHGRSLEGGEPIPGQAGGARQDSLPDGWGETVSRVCQHFGDEKRVAHGLPEERVGIQFTPPNQAAYRGRAETAAGRTAGRLPKRAVRPTPCAGDAEG